MTQETTRGIDRMQRTESLIGTVLLIIIKVPAAAGCTGAHPVTITETALSGDNEIAIPISQWRSNPIGGVPQWIQIAGADRDLPVLLFLHGGPGTPETAFLHEYIPQLVEEVVLVSWEQRGAGRSLSPSIPPETMTIQQFIRDTLELSTYLRDYFGVEKIYLAGHSWGTIVGILATALRPEDFHAYIAIAQTVHSVREEMITYERVLDQARTAGHRRAVPVYFFHGRHDNQVPPEVAMEFFESLEAPMKQFYLFEDSAHGVLFEEPELFLKVLRDDILSRETSR